MRGRRCPAVRSWALAAVALVLGAAGVQAQVEEQATLRGTVRVGPAPLPGAQVMLHRVDALDAGEIDSIRSDADGAFAFDLPSLPDPGGAGEVYFASVRHDGLLYFGPPIATVAELDSAYLVQAYDTAQAAPGGETLPLEVRYFLIEDSAEGWSVTDLLQIAVEGERTLVPAEDDVVWSYPLPPGVLAPTVAGGDISPAATRLTEGRIDVSMPLSPGSRQLAITYRLDSLALTVPLPGRVDEVELLVREPAPPLEVVGLTAAEPIEAPDGVYRRYVGIALQDASVSLRSTGEPSRLPVRELAVAMALVLGAFGAWLLQRTSHRARPTSPAPASTGTTPADVRSRLVLAIAQLDEELSGADPVRSEKIRAERERLVERLRELS